MWNCIVWTTCIFHGEDFISLKTPLIVFVSVGWFMVFNDHFQQYFSYIMLVLPVVAMFVNGSGQNEQSLRGPS
jgi:hypothetical protein